jgi:hypothetical protein
MKILNFVLALFLVFAIPAFGQHQCADARPTVVPMTSTTTQVRVSSGNPDISGYEVHIAIAYPTPNGPITKREKQYVDAGAPAVFNVPAEQITEVTVLCYTGDQDRPNGRPRVPVRCAVCTGPAEWQAENRLMSATR